MASSNDNAVNKKGRRRRRGKAMHRKSSEATQFCCSAVSCRFSSDNFSFSFSGFFSGSRIIVTIVPLFACLFLFYSFSLKFVFICAFALCYAMCVFLFISKYVQFICLFMFYWYEIVVLFWLHIYAIVNYRTV